MQLCLGGKATPTRERKPQTEIRKPNQPTIDWRRLQQNWRCPVASLQAQRQVSASSQPTVNSQKRKATAKGPSPSRRSCQLECRARRADRGNLLPANGSTK